MSSATPGSRNLRKALLGFVTSRSGDKSVKVTIPYKTPHPLYHKVINRKTVVHVHDEKNETKVGDKVKIMETRPISRLKRWRIVSIVHSAVGTTHQAPTFSTSMAAPVARKTSCRREITGLAKSSPSGPEGGLGTRSSPGRCRPNCRNFSISWSPRPRRMFWKGGRKATSPSR
jgi:small subunit ribosomal protein S17